LLTPLLGSLMFGALAVPSPARADALDGHTAVAEIRGVWIDDIRRDRPNGQTVWRQRERPWTWNFRIFKVGPNLFVNQPPHQPGTAFLEEGGEIENAGFLAHPGSFFCQNIVFEGGVGVKACGRFSTEDGGYRITLLESNDLTEFRMEYAFVLAVQPGRCAIVSSGGEQSFIDRRADDPFMPLQPGEEAWVDHGSSSFRHAGATCTLQPGRTPFKRAG